MSETTAAVLVPVKSFAVAKVRLAGVLAEPERARLARAMAERVVVAAAPLPCWCVCDDPEVRDWALGVGAQVDWTPGLGLNGAVQRATEHRRADGVTRVVVAHGDLPFAAGLSTLAEADADELVIVPDRRGTGSNVVSVPTGAGFRFAYGVGSFARHLAEAERCGLSVRVERSEHLGWDIDEPDDLHTPEHLGVVPGAPP